MAIPFFNKETRNLSFISEHRKLQNLDVYDPFFMLTTYNEKLKGPFDYYDYVYGYNRKRYSSTAQSEIYEECANNPWFFFREIAKVPVNIEPSTDKSKSLFYLNYSLGNNYILNDIEMKMIYCFAHNISFIVCKKYDDINNMRKIGVKTTLMLMILYLQYTTGIKNLPISINEKEFIYNDMDIDIDAFLQKITSNFKLYENLSYSNSHYILDYSELLKDTDSEINPIMVSVKKMNLLNKWNENKILIIPDIINISTFMDILPMYKNNPDLMLYANITTAYDNTNEKMKQAIDIILDNVGTKWKIFDWSFVPSSEDLVIITN